MRLVPWLLIVAMFAIVVVLFWDDNVFISFRKFLWLGLALFLIFLLFKNRPKRSSWGSDDLIFEPELSRPVSTIDQELEWKWTNHPLVRFPLAFTLIPLMYWVFVIHKMKLPGSWLVGVAIFVLISIWSWHEPLMLMLLVGSGVGLLYGTAWVIQNLSVGEILGLICLLAILGLVGFKELRKRNIIR